MKTSGSTFLEDWKEHYRFDTGPYPCSYLPDRTANLDYRILTGVTPVAYLEFLRRGWRRFGYHYFRPACAHCVKCRSIRINVNEFKPTKSQRRTLKRNAHIRVRIQRPSVSQEHLDLYQIYHDDMNQRRGWPIHPISERRYAESFLQGGGEFSREFLYYDGDTLVGVGLVDLVPEAGSSIYFFHHPDWRPLAPGVFSLLYELQYARENGHTYHYLGYWIPECQSMAYKSQYRPHEILERYPEDDEEPEWYPPEEETEGS